MTATPERGSGRGTGRWPEVGSGSGFGEGFDGDPGDRDPIGPVIRDRRRIDPVTGAVRERPEATRPAGPPPDTMESLTARVAELESALAERTADLQRLQAEYVNYKRRVDRDRDVVRDSAVAGVLSQLLPVLDDIGRARDHGELEGGFKAVAESFERIVTGLGLERYGEPGEPFDPHVHEALMHSYSPDVEVPTAQMVLQDGYRFRDRIVRAARVAVVEPEGMAIPDPSQQVESKEVDGDEAAEEVDAPQDASDDESGDQQAG